METAHSPSGILMSAATGICYLCSFADIDAYVLTPTMHITTILVGVATLYFYFKPKKKNTTK